MFQLIYSQTCGAHGNLNHSVDPIWIGIGWTKYGNRITFKCGRRRKTKIHVAFSSPVIAPSLIKAYNTQHVERMPTTYLPMTILFLARSRSNKAASNIRSHRVKCVNWLTISEVNWFGCLAQWEMRWDSISPWKWKLFASSVSARLGAMPTRID